MKASLQRLIELQKLLLAFSQVDRRVDREHDNQYIAENDTEHSYNLAMTGWYLSQWFPELDRNLVIQYALVHDLVEVHAGDTYIYGTDEELASKEHREAKALEKLAADWPDFQSMSDAIHAYENRTDAESRFVYALDKVMPMMLIYINDGYTWKKEGITLDMLYDTKIEKIKISPEVYPYFEQIHALLLERPDLIKNGKSPLL
ncbi:MAG: HD domain-containing protein [Patescibacteria group bacterium]